MSEQDYVILTLPPKKVRGQLFIAGSETFKDAELTVTIADTNVLDAAEKVLGTSTLKLSTRPVSNWVAFEVELNSDLVKKYDIVFLDRLSIRVSIDVDGKLAYLSKVSNPVDLSGTAPVQFATVVAEPV